MSQRLTELYETYVDRTAHKHKWGPMYLLMTAWEHFIGIVGDMKVRDFSLDHAEIFQATLARRKYKPRTINGYVKAISPMFTYAVKHRLIDRNPFIGIGHMKVPQKEVETFSIEEVQMMVAASPDDMWRARILAAATAGLRRTEVMNLTFDEIHGDCIVLQAKDDTDRTWRWCPKSYLLGRLPLAPQLSQLFMKLLAELPAGQPYPMLEPAKYAERRAELLAGTLSERHRQSPTEYWKPFKDLLDRLGMRKNRSFHNLRKTAITQWSRMVPPQDLKTLARHADIETTVRYYSAVSSDLLDRAVITVG